MPQAAPVLAWMGANAGAIASVVGATASVVSATKGGPKIPSLPQEQKAPNASTFRARNQQTGGPRPPSDLTALATGSVSLGTGGLARSTLLGQ
jgi:hypothetical protein